MPQHDTRTSASTTSTSTETGTSTATGSQVQDLVGNQAVVDIIRSENESTGERAADPNKTGIVHMGMNKDAYYEAKALNRANRGRGGAVSVRNQPEQDKLNHQGSTYDLTTETGAAQFVATLGLPNQQAVDAAQFILETGSDARDEAAQLIRVYSEAEMGARTMERLVLSGHSVGSQVWGDDNGSLAFKHLIRLSNLFPAATGQVKHLMLSACYSGTEAKMAQYHDMFPNLKSITAYHGSSPGTWTGAIPHLEAWEGLTEEGDEVSGVDPEMSEGMRKSENMSTWNAEDGYQGDKPMKLYELSSQLSNQSGVFDDHFSGATPVANAQSGPLRDYYGLVQRLLGHPEASADQVTTFTGRRDATIRLLYWQVINDKFMQVHGQEITDAYSSLGETMPDFASLGRAEALQAIEAFIAAGGSGRAADLLGRGLRDLDPEIILTQWV